MTLPEPYEIIKAVSVFCIGCAKKSCQIRDLALLGQNPQARWIKINGIVQCRAFKSKPKPKQEKSIFDILEG